jgi:hypothetical protein
MAAENVYIGTYARGNMNVMVGHEAGLRNEANGNVFVGRSTAIQNRTGENNVAVGLDAARMNESGCVNTHVGFRAGFENRGNNNISIGAFSGNNTSEGVIAIGNGTGAAGSSIVTNSVCIGHGAKTAVGNAVVLTAQGRVTANQPGLFVRPMRAVPKEGVPSKCLWYNQETGEICFAP